MLCIHLHIFVYLRDYDIKFISRQLENRSRILLLDDHQKRAGLSSFHLLHFYTTVIRPVLEYASLLWHLHWPSLILSVWRLFKEGLLTLFFVTSPLPYLSILALAGILSTQASRVDLSKRLFRNICWSDNCLQHLLPPSLDLAVT